MPPRRAALGLIVVLAACGPAYGPGDTVGLVPVTGEPRAEREATLRGGNADTGSAAPQTTAAPVTVPPPVAMRPVRLGARPAQDGPNVVAFALATNHAVGTSRYGRSDPSADRAERACARYVSDDLAQEAFLQAGGPEGDRLGMDPDGDGYACGWDPERFRRAVR
jgi:hypothetical protein